MKKGDFAYHTRTEKVYKVVNIWSYDVDVISPNGRRSQVSKEYIVTATENQIETLWYQQTEEGKKAMEEVLYEVPRGGKTVFAKKLTVNSGGLWVMEAKGTGEVFTANKDDCTEVVQYTVKVKNISTGDVNSYVAEQGKFGVGDVFIMKSGSFVVVSEVDTKDRRTTAEFKPSRRFVLEDV